MLKLLTSDAFAAWFAALPAAPAEDVATSLEVIVQLGTRADAPGSSDLLLWYEHPSLAQRPLPDMSKVLPPELVKFTQDWGYFNDYVSRVVKHLKSKAFVARLERVSPDAAAAVASAVARLRRLATTRALAVSDCVSRRHLAPKASQILAYARLTDVSEIRAAYFAALAAAGFEAADVPSHSTALREITLRSTAPGLRLLYGIDEPRDRGLVVLGEWLDRSFYGDAVRRAEAVWAEFRDGRPLPAEAAGTR